MKAFLPRIVSVGIQRTFNYLVEGRFKPGWVRYGMAAIWVLLALGFRTFLQEPLGERVPFTFFLIASMMAAWCGGAGPGLFALVMGIILGDWLFLQNPARLWGYGVVEWALLLGTILPGLIAILLFETLHVIRRRLRIEKRSLAAEIRKRKELELQLETARSEVTHYAEALESAVSRRTNELNEAVGFLERFCYSIAHDLRAPVRAMTGLTGNLLTQTDVQLSEESRQMAERVVASSKRMNQLVTDLLEYGRLSHVQLHYQRLDLNPVIFEVLGGLGDMIHETKAKVDVRSPLHPVWADANLLYHVLHQLLKNSIQFARPGEQPEIAIWTETMPSVTRLFVADNGSGIAKEYLNKIFGLFHTLGTDQEHPHTGVGLAIVAKAVERMYGSVDVRSECGVGTTFVLDLPNATPAYQTLPRPEAAMRSFSLEVRTSDTPR